MRKLLEHALQRRWYAPNPSRFGALSLLRPAAWLTGVYSRRSRRRIVRANASQQPIVIVVGNLVAGGSGKTPAVLRIAEYLHLRGWRVGLICHAYRGPIADAQIVRRDSAVAQVGDEALLLAQQSGLPVASGSDRGQALRLICEQHPDLQVIIADDGLQHRPLVRHLELAVFGPRGAGNAQLLPAGPLREPLVHALQMDALLLNETRQTPIAHPTQFRLQVVASRLVPLRAFHSEQSDKLSIGEACSTLKQWAPGELIAIAGVGDPARFEKTLANLGLECKVTALGDHAYLDCAMIRSMPGKAIIMTAKDAVKLRDCDDARCWVLEVTAEFEPAFFRWLEQRLAALLPQ